MTLRYFQSLKHGFPLKVILGVVAITFGFQNYAEESLITRPPFKPVERSSDRSFASNLSTQGSINQRFELASILSIGGELKFSIHDKQTNKPLWLGIGENIEGIRLESYDSQQIGVVVNQAGERELLVLREMKQNSNTRSGIPAYNTITPVQNYPKPPPSLPEPNKLLEQIRKKKE